MEKVGKSFLIKMKKVVNISILLFVFVFLRIIIIFLIKNIINFPDEITSAIIYMLIGYVTDIPIIYYFVKNNKKRKYFIEKEKLSIKSFISCFALMSFISIITSILFFIFKLGLRKYGDEVLSSYPIQPLTIIFINIFSTVIMVPIAEEIIFRGVIMNDLSEYGYKSTILINSVLFALSHTGIERVVMTFLFGIVFSYIAYKFSLKYSILLHMVWNLCFGLGNSVQSLGEAAIIITGISALILSIILLIVFIVGTANRKYSILFSIFKLDIDDKNNMILFFKNNTVFILIILIIFSINCYIFYL
jgi:putative protease